MVIGGVFWFDFEVAGNATTDAVVTVLASRSAAGGGLGWERSSSAADCRVDVAFVAAVRGFAAALSFGDEPPPLPGRKSTVITSPVASWRSPCSTRTASLKTARY